MADSIRLRIIDAIVARMGDDTLYTTVANYAQEEYIERTGVLDGDEDNEQRYAHGAKSFQVQVEKWVPCKNKDGTFSSTVISEFASKKSRAHVDDRELLAYAKVSIGNNKYAAIEQTVMTGDRTFGGLAADIKMVGGGPDYSDDSDYVAVRAIFEISYETPLTDPFTVQT